MRCYSTQLYTVGIFTLLMIDYFTSLMQTRAVAGQWEATDTPSSSENSVAHRTYTPTAIILRRYVQISGCSDPLP